MGRAPCCDKANVKKGPWSPEEDATLKAYIKEHGTGGNWIALPRKIGLKRCGKSCRLRWLNYLRPNIRHGEFSEEEDNIICSLYISIGSRWSIIAAQLPGRTDNDIKNYWNTRLKKKLLGNKQRSKAHHTRRTGCSKQENIEKRPSESENFPTINHQTNHFQELIPLSQSLHPMMMTDQLQASMKDLLVQLPDLITPQNPNHIAQVNPLDSMLGHGQPFNNYSIFGAPYDMNTVDSSPSLFQDGVQDSLTMYQIGDSGLCNQQTRDPLDGLLSNFCGTEIGKNSIREERCSNIWDEISSLVSYNAYPPLLCDYEACPSGRVVVPEDSTVESSRLLYGTL